MNHPPRTTKPSRDWTYIGINVCLGVIAVCMILAVVGLVLSMLGVLPQGHGG